MKIIHEKLNVGKLNCKQCEKSYMSESALNYHIDIVHASGGKEFKCKDCEKSFKHKMLLERHKNSYHCIVNTVKKYNLEKHTNVFILVNRKFLNVKTVATLQSTKVT